MGRKIWFVAVGGLVLFVLAGVLGYGVDVEEDGFRLHLFLAMAAGLLIFFTHGYLVVYLILTGRLLRRTEVPDSGAQGELAELRRRVLRRGRWVIPVLVVAAAGAVLTVTLGASVYTEVLSLATHQLLAWGTVALEIVALGLAWPLLGRHETLIRRTDSALSRAA